MAAEHTIWGTGFATLSDDGSGSYQASDISKRTVGMLVIVKGGGGWGPVGRRVIGGRRVTVPDFVLCEYSTARGLRIKD